jgi:hypothetical protein
MDYEVGGAGIIWEDNIKIGLIWLATGNVGGF